MGFDIHGESEAEILMKAIKEFRGHYGMAPAQILMSPVFYWYFTREVEKESPSIVEVTHIGDIPVTLRVMESDEILYQLVPEKE